MSELIEVIHLSDTHFTEEGAEPEGGFSYEVNACFDAVLSHLGNHQHHTMVAVTGDVTDHGRSGQYRVAADALARFDVPVNVISGNHDQHAAFTAGMGRPGVGTSRVIEVGAWTFLFVDSCAGVMAEHRSGRTIDSDDPLTRLHSNGALGERESSWIREMCTITASEHVFVWVHHPPGTSVPISKSDSYANEWSSVLADHPEIRGFGAGHTHVPAHYEFEGRPVHVAPSLKHCFDLEANTWLPPGYLTYQFNANGTFTSRLHLVDDERWPRRRLHPKVRAIIMEESSS